MSKTGPSAFVVVGDTDWIDTTNANQGAGYRVDSRLRRALRNNSSTPTAGCAFGKRLKVPTVGGYYAEFQRQQSAVADRFAVCGDNATLNTILDPGNATGCVMVRSDGNVYQGGSVVTSGASFGPSDRAGIHVYLDSGVVKLRYYVNGTAQGSAVTLTGATSARLALFCYDNGSDITIYCDAAELRYLPAGAQPWGAAARVADVGGYSPAATIFTAAGGTTTIGSFEKTASSTTASGGAICDSARNLSGKSGLYYFEIAVEAVGPVAPIGGLAARGWNTANTFVGVTADSWGYYGSDGNKYNNGATAYGATYTTGDRIGVIWEPSTGKLYWSKNGGVQGGGNPQAGSGAAYTNATGDLVPAWSPYSGRVRLCTHAREQLYRPSYCEAWDGADLLPECYFSDRLGAAPIVRRAVSYYPWAASGSRGAPIGGVDLINADGEFDELTDWDLRDQDCVAYRLRDDGTPGKEWTGVVESVEHSDFNTCRVIVADKTAPLDVRVSSPVFGVGSPELVPVTPRQGSTLAYDIAHGTDVGFEVYDQALIVDDWQRADSGGVTGFERTVNPAGRQSVRDLQIVSVIQQLTISNYDFSAWTGGVPDNWTYVETDPTGSVTQSGNTAVLNNGAGQAYLFHALTITQDSHYLLRVKLGTSSYGHSVQFGASTGTTPPLTSAGVKHTFDNTNTGAELAFVAQATANASYIFLTVTTAGGIVAFDTVEVYEVQPTTAPQDAFTYLLETQGGLSSSDWSYSAPLSPYSPGKLGYWSDERPTIRAVFDEVCDSLLVDYYTDNDGVIKLAWLTPPDEVTSSDDLYLGEIAEAEVFSDLTVQDDFAPRLSTRAEYQRNYVQHNDGDIAGSVSNTDRQYFTSEGKENAITVTGAGSPDSEAGNLHPFYGFANNAPAMPRLLVNDFTDEDTPSDGSATVDNRLILLHRCYAQRRRFYSLSISRNKADELGIHCGGVVNVTHARYGLSAGKNLMITAIEQDITAPTVALQLWG